MADGERPPRGARRLKLLVLAVGKASKGPERELCARYAERAGKLGKAMGVSGVAVTEVADRQGPSRRDVEGRTLLSAAPKGVLVALDEAGEAWSSRAFASRLGAWLDGAVPSVSFLIGGAEGHGPALRQAADHTLSLSAMTLPHLLARALLLEQIYRAMTIHLGHPYHRA